MSAFKAAGAQRVGRPCQTASKLPRQPSSSGAARRHGAARTVPVQGVLEATAAWITSAPMPLSNCFQTGLTTSTHRWRCSGER